jgi:amidase
MKRIPRHKTVPPDKRHVVREPAAEVELGETFLVETINFRTPIIRSKADANPDVYREREETGPIFVKGVAGGEAIAIHILSISPEGHASGGSLPDRKENSFLEISAGQVRFPGGLSLPLRMMIGDIRVQPVKPGPHPWDYGGNMDFKDIAPGNVLLFEAQLPGALIVLGDVHAAQGDGEIEGVGAECAAEVVLKVTKAPGLPVERPVVLKENSFVTIACRTDYAAARDLAVEDAVRLLLSFHRCAESEARLYVRTVGDLRNGAVWSMGKAEPAWCKHLPLVIGMEVPLNGGALAEYRDLRGRLSAAGGPAGGEP